MSEDTSVSYMQKSRDYYAAHGYEKPYRWAHYESTPFTSLRKPLDKSRVTIVTTAMPDDRFKGPHRKRAVGNLNQPPEAFFTDDLAWDKDATHTRDLGTYFPVAELRRQIEAGRLGELASEFHCVPTTYSARQTTDQDAPAIVDACVAQEVDIAILIPL